MTLKSIFTCDKRSGFHSYDLFFYIKFRHIVFLQRDFRPFIQNLSIIVAVYTKYKRRKRTSIVTVNTEERNLFWELSRNWENSSPKGDWSRVIVWNQLSTQPKSKCQSVAFLSTKCTPREWQYLCILHFFWFWYVSKVQIAVHLVNIFLHCIAFLCVNRRSKFLHQPRPPKLNEQIWQVGASVLTKLWRNFKMKVFRKQIAQWPLLNLSSQRWPKMP